MEMVILVDKYDMAIGTMEKMEAHRKGVLHRAFSVMVFNSQGEILLQRRAKTKYHSGGLWTNACCSHPMPGENMKDAARRRLREEMGIDMQPEFSYKFIYKADLDQGLIEHECDYVFTGTFDGEPSVNAAEVEDWKFVPLAWVKSDLEKNPAHYTSWFSLILGHPPFNS